MVFMCLLERMELPVMGHPFEGAGVGHPLSWILGWGGRYVYEWEREDIVVDEAVEIRSRSMRV